MLLNKVNLINAMIAAISAPEGLLRMSEYKHEISPEMYIRFTPRADEPCGTAYCMAGWANKLQGRPPEDLTQAALDLGLNNEQRHALFLFRKEYASNNRDHLVAFDTVLTRVQQKAIVIDLLTNLRDTGTFSVRESWEKCAPGTSPHGLDV